MSTKYNTRITRLTVMPEGEPIFSELGTNIEINDEAAGEFVQLTQHRDQEREGCGTVTINPDEWPAIKGAVDQMIGYIELHKKPEPAPARKRDGTGELMD